MRDGVKIAAILAGAILGAALLISYFSPYHSCVRAMKAAAAPGSVSSEPGRAEAFCRNSN